MTQDYDTQTGAYSEITKSISEKAESTQQLDEKYQGQIRGGAIKPPFDPTQMAELLEINTTHAKCVYSKGRNVAGYGLEIVPHPDVEDPDESQKAVAEEFWSSGDSDWQVGPVNSERSTPADVLEMAWNDFEAIGWLSIEMLTATDGTPTGLAYVPAMTIRRRREKPGYVQLRRARLQYFGNAGDRYEDPPTFVDGKTGRTGKSVENPANELIFKRNHSPLYTYYGGPDIIPALPTVQGDNAAREFNIDFFENNAVPRMAVIVEGGELTEKAREDIHDLLHGMRDNDHRTIVLEAEKLLKESGGISVDGDEDDLKIRVEPLTVGIDEDASFQEFRDRNEHEILKTHDVPPIEAGQIKSGSFSTDAEAQRRGYIETVIQPKQEAFAELLYETVHDALGVTDYTVKFHSRGVDSRQTDAEIARTRIAAARGAMTINEAREELGLEPLDGEQGEDLLADIDDDSSDPMQRQAADGKDSAYGPPAEDDPIRPPRTKQIGGRVRVDSSNLSEVGYDDLLQVLEIKFRGGRVYQYYEVPAQVHEALLNAASKGKYHHRNIKWDFEYRRIV